MENGGVKEEGEIPFFMCWELDQIPDDSDDEKEVYVTAKRISKVSRPKPVQHPLIDCGVLEMVDKKVKRQGRIVNVFDQTAMVQTYDWIIGGDSSIELVQISDIGDKRDNGWLLFADDDARNDWYNTYGKART